MSSENFSAVDVSATIKRAAISTNASADVIAAVTGKKIRVLQFCVNTLTAVTVKFQSGASSDLTGAMGLGATSVLAPPFCPVGLFETVAGEKLNVVLGSGVQTSGWIVYQEI